MIFWKWKALICAKGDGGGGGGGAGASETGSASSADTTAGDAIGQGEGLRDSWGGGTNANDAATGRAPGSAGYGAEGGAEATEPGVLSKTFTAVFDSFVPGAINSISKATTGKTIGQHVSGIAASVASAAKAKGATDAEAHEAGLKAGREAAETLGDGTYGSAENRNQVLSSINNITPRDMSARVQGASSLGSVQDAAQTEDMWQQYIDRAMVELEPAVRSSTDFMAKESEEYGKSVADANSANTNTLNTLANQLQTQTGVYTPTKTNWGTYQPGSNRINARTLISSADAMRDNAKDTATTKYSTAPERMPEQGTLKTLALLQDLAEKDKAYGLTEDELALKKYLGDISVSSDKYAVDKENEVGTLDKLTNLIQTGSSIFDLGKSFNWWGA